MAVDALWWMFDFHHIGHIWHTRKAESAILAATFIGTLINLELGIFLGVFLSLLMFLYRTSKPKIIPVVPTPEEGAYGCGDVLWQKGINA